MGSTVNLTLQRLAAALFAAALVAACGSDANESLRQAKAAESKGDYTAAVIHLKNVVRERSEDPELRLQLGRLYNLTAKGPNAEAELRRAKELGVASDRLSADLALALWLNGDFKTLVNDVDVPEHASAESRAAVLAFRGRAHAQLGQVSAARESFTKAREAAGTLYIPAVVLLEAHLKIAERDRTAALGLVESVLAKDPRHYDALRLKADLLLADGDEAAAVKAYGEILKTYPTDLFALVGRSAILIRQGKHEAAEVDVNTLQSAHNAHYAWQFQLGLLKLRKGQFRGAVEALQAAHKKEPSFSPTLKWLGISHLLVGEALQAERALTQYMPASPNDAVALRALATALMQLNEPERVLALLTPILAAGKADVRLFELAVDAHVRTGNIAKALEWLDKAAKFQPDNQSMRERRAMVQLLGGQTAAALDELDKLVQTRTQASNAEMILFAAQLKRGELDKAQATIERLEKKSPNEAFLLNLRGTVLLQRGKQAEAIAAFEDAVKKQPAFLPAAANLIKLDLRAGNLESARQRVERVLAADKNHFEALLLASNLARAANKPEEATVYLKRATISHPHQAEPWQRLVSTHLRRRDFEGAMQVAQDFANRNPKSFAAADMIGRVQLAQGDANSAVATYSRLSADYPKLERAHMALAEAQLTAKRMTDAERSLRRVLEINPNHREGQLAWVGLMVSQRRVDEAGRFIQGLQKERTTSQAGLMLEADLLWAQGKYLEAAKVLSNILAKAPRDDVAVRLYEAQAKAGDNKNALVGLRRFADQHPEALLARVHLAEVLLRSGDITGAIKHYEPAAKSPNVNPLVLNNLAFAYYKLNDPRAHAIAEQAYDAAPDNPVIMDTLALISLREGNAKRAVDLLEMAVKAMPHYPEIRFHLASALHKTGDHARAKAELTQLLQKHKNFQDREEAVALLKAIGA